ncbi:hypothetical protein [Actinacidiphila acidipaludis]|uniref:Uncharacterized protein n=1 Tax=Actinacidiphila acidipaludis TaxID=2873382 RepID=A0ABS7Q3V4_9ACTN|nr:hypothetical protein [Streptomyces acidipaludis]MBY8877840.1 hypothetical protein [Streptomyces acidipaludis]
MRRRSGFTVTRDGSYGACLAEADGGWFAERWTLGGPETYAVPLPGAQPEEPGTPVAPLPDGRVLVLRRVGDRYDPVLLHPTGPGTGELALGSLTGAEVRLLPPSPVPGTAFVLACTDDVSTVFQVLGTRDAAPMAVTTIRGRCTGGVWLDREGRLLALDRELDGRAKAIAADLHNGTTSPLLQLTDDSDDRLVLAEPDSGLLVLRSDAAGGSRLGWGLLGSTRPVRFPDALCVPGLQLSPVAAQPGQILSPESVVVALRAEMPGGAESVALWRPGERHVHWRAAPAGWLSGAALWLPGTDLRLPYAAPEPALMRYDTPPPEPHDPAASPPPAGPGAPTQAGPGRPVLRVVTALPGPGGPAPQETADPAGHALPDSASFAAEAAEGAEATEATGRGPGTGTAGRAAPVPPPPEVVALAALANPARAAHPAPGQPALPGDATAPPHTNRLLHTSTPAMNKELEDRQPDEHPGCAQPADPARPAAPQSPSAEQAPDPGAAPTANPVAAAARLVRETGRAKVVRRWAAVVPLQQAPLSGVAGSPA